MKPQFSIKGRINLWEDCWGIITTTICRDFLFETRYGFLQLEPSGKNQGHAWPKFLAPTPEYLRCTEKKAPTPSTWLEEG